MKPIDYKTMIEDSMLDVVKKCLKNAEIDGIDENSNHFFITFDTYQPGVDFPKNIKFENPETITIVLQREFLDLKIDEKGFSVSLTLNEELTKVYIPFSSIRRFKDPFADIMFIFEKRENIAKQEEEFFMDNVVSILNFKKKE